MKQDLIDGPTLKSALSVCRPTLQGAVGVDKIELRDVTLEAGETYEIIMTSPDDEQVRYIVARGNLYIVAQRDLEAATAP